MASEAQIRANRANAQKSTGPRTPEGKARASQNATKHGFSADLSLANENQVFAAIARITDPAGIRLGARHITVSTVGLVPGIRNLATAHPQVGLAVSLHAADDATRTRLVPINRRYPLAELEEAVQSWRVLTNRRPSIEWAMIDGENDSDDQARQLAGFAKRTRAHVNLIPLNPTPGYPTVGSTPQRVAEFHHKLVDLGVNATVRRNRGTDIDAACGQLAAGQPVTLTAPRRAD